MPETCGFANDIFNLETKIRQQNIQNRIKFAFEKNGETGKDFWEIFFSCEEYHTDCDRFIYYFSEEQLGILYDWWKSKTEIDNTATPAQKELRENLLLSQHSCFTNLKEGDIITEKVFACYTFHKNIGGRFRKLILHPSILEGETDNFFTGSFGRHLHNGPGIKKNVAECQKYLKNLLDRNLTRRLRNKIKERFNTPIKNGKWLFYNGFNYGCNDEITYCSAYCRETKKKCPFV